jgi:transcriptional regulator with XRE-family HTH domain
MARRLPVGRLEVRRRQQRLRSAIATQLLELRREAGVSQTALAAAAGMDQAHVSRIERGRGQASIDAVVALAASLGADVSVRLFPTAAAPRLRDHLQAPMIEAIVREIRDPWRATPEVPVPEARGVVDLVLRNRPAGIVIACEAHSQLRSLDLVLRRLHEKELALARLEAADATVSSMLLLRSTESTRRIVRLHEALFAATFPGSTTKAIDLLGGQSGQSGQSGRGGQSGQRGRDGQSGQSGRGGQSGQRGQDDWTGATLLWVRIEGGRAELLRRPPRGIAVGR